MTLEAWIKPTQLTSWRQVIPKEQPSGVSYAQYSSTDTHRPNTEVGSSSTLYGPSVLTVGTALGQIAPPGFEPGTSPL